MPEHHAHAFPQPEPQSHAVSDGHPVSDLLPHSDIVPNADRQPERDPDSSAHGRPGSLLRGQELRGGPPFRQLSGGLGPSQQEQPESSKWGTLAEFTKERAAFLATAGTDYQEELSPTNTLTLRQWIEGANWLPQIDQVHAFLVSVKWTAITSAYAGWEIWIVNPTKTGWSLYQAR